MRRGLFTLSVVLSLTAACGDSAREDTSSSSTSAATGAGAGPSSTATASNGSSSSSGAGGTGGGGGPVTLCDSPLDPTSMVPELGKAYHVTKNFGFRGDSNEEPLHSALELFEDGTALGPAHSVHQEIRDLGGGRYSHWYNGLYFSSSDDSDPRSNGRVYTVRGPCHTPRPLELALLGESNTGYATFQSHMQRMVSNEHGIFVTYLAEELSDGRLVFRLTRSTDGGETFSTLYEGTFKSKAPAVETDEDGNVYLFHAEDYDDSSKPALFYRFDAAADFQNPLITTIPLGSAGKFAALYDAVRQRFYYFTFWDAPHPNFYTVSKDGVVIAQTSLTVPGALARIQYPHLVRDGARIYAAWTTQHLSSMTPAYRSVHFMFSDDGGVSWSTPSGSVTIPVVGDDSGVTPQIVLADELDVSTWLSSFTVRGPSAHFFYYASSPLDRQHQVRIETATGARTLDRYPTWTAGSASIASLDGFFVSAPAPLPLFAVARDTQDRIAVVASDDDGTTWLDYAISEPIDPGFAIYSIGGARELGPDGALVGTFTEQDLSGTQHRVRFFRVEAEAWD